MVIFMPLSLMAVWLNPVALIAIPLSVDSYHDVMGRFHIHLVIGALMWLRSIFVRLKSSGKLQALNIVWPLVLAVLGAVAVVILAVLLLGGIWMALILFAFYGAYVPIAIAAVLLYGWINGLFLNYLLFDKSIMSDIRKNFL